MIRAEIVMHQHRMLEFLGDGELMVTVAVTDEVEDEGRDGGVGWVGSEGSWVGRREGVVAPWCWVG